MEPEPTSGGPRAARAGAAARLAAPAAVALAFAVAAVRAWGRLGEVVVDTGRELDVPRRLLAGERLYADVRWYYGPLAPWVNAALYRAFGVRIGVLAWAGLVTAALVAAVVYLLAREFAGRVPAAAAAIAFVFLGAFSNTCGYDICNFVLPYSFAATYGMLAAAASLLLLVRHARRGRAADFLASCALLAIAALAKIEPLAPAVAAHALFAVGAAWTRRLRAWPHAAGWGGAAGIAAAAYGGLAARVGWRTLWDGNLRALANRGSDRFIAWSMGIDRPLASLGRAAASAALLAGVLVAAALASRAAGRARSRVGAGALALLAGAAAFAAYAWAGPGEAFRAVPFVLAGALVALAWRFARDPAARARLLPRALLLAFALVALGRILLRVNLDVYGFFLLPVALAALAAWMSETVPDALGAVPEGRRAFALAAAGLLCGAAFAEARDARPFFDERTVAVESPRGTLRVPAREAGVARMVDALRAFPPGTTLLALPEGAGFDFLAGLTPADPYSSHLPMEFPDDASDRAELERLRRAPPDLVLVVGRDMTEFGSRGFGVDYGRRTAAWIARRYRAIAQTQPGVTLYARYPRDAPPAG